MSNVSDIIRNIHEYGDAATEELIPLIYAELRRLASSRLSKNAVTMTPTELVHEAYARMLGQEAPDLRHRAQFFGVAARAMRQVIVDRVRERRAAKRGGGWHRVSLTGFANEAGGADVDLVELDEALEKLDERSPRAARVVELRFFSGCTIPEAAEVLQVSHFTVEGDWWFARAWLARELSGGGPSPTTGT